MGGATIHDASGGDGCNGGHTSCPIHIPVDYGPGDGSRDVDPSDHSMKRGGHQCWAGRDDQVDWGDRHPDPVNWALPKDGQCQDVIHFLVGLREVWRVDRLAVMDEWRVDRLAMMDEWRVDRLAVMDEWRVDRLVMMDEWRVDRLAMMDEWRGDRLVMMDEWRAETVVSMEAMAALKGMMVLWTAPRVASMEMTALWTAWTAALTGTMVLWTALMVASMGTTVESMASMDVRQMAFLCLVGSAD